VQSHRNPPGWDALRASTVENADDVWGDFEIPVIIDQPQATATAADLLRQSDLDGSGAASSLKLNVH